MPDKQQSPSVTELCERLTRKRFEALLAEREKLRGALSKAYGRWSLGCFPDNDFPDWPDDPMSVMNDLWKDGWPAMADAALSGIAQGQS